jgi:sugar phosphate isomerase/epimerase
LDEINKLGVAFAAEVAPGQSAFDLYSAETTLQALSGHSAFGFAFNPALLHWQGIDGALFLRAHAQHIWHVHIQDLNVCLDGRSGILGSFLPVGDPRRGWSFRTPGQGNIDWPNILRALHQIGYDGPMSVAFADPDVDRDYGAAESVAFLRRLDFEPARPSRGTFG